jgi:hypothetical protein
MKLNEISENISHTSKRLRDIERNKGVKPGTEEWFKLWFSLPYLKESADEVYDILDNVECGPFDGGCVLVAQALQQIHGGDIVVLVNDKGIADHAAVKVGNNLIDFDGALPVKQFVKRFEDNEHTNIKSIRPIQKGDLPEAPRDKELVPQLVNALTESTFSEGYKIQLERDPNMYVLHILDTKTGKRTEVRGKSGYESGNYDPNDPLHQLLDKIGKASNISDLINGEVTGINVKHPDGERATAAADRAFNESVSGEEMLKMFHDMHHDAGMNPDMDEWVKSREWGIDTVDPKDIVDFEELFDYDDPFDRIIDVDEQHVKSYMAAIQAGRKLDPVILGPKHSDGKYSIVDGNHRALAYAALDMPIPAYMPMGKVDENFADGKKKGKSRPGRVKRSGASCNGSVTELRRKAKKYSGERGKMYHWCANMKSGKKK